LPFAEVGKAAEKLLRDHDLENGVPQELETLVVEGVILPLQRNARVSEGLCEKQGVAELVSDPLLKRIHQVTFDQVRGIHAVLQ
jgi:hypothetical protein